MHCHPVAEVGMLHLCIHAFPVEFVAQLGFQLLHSEMFVAHPLKPVRATQRPNAVGKGVLARIKGMTPGMQSRVVGTLRSN